MGAGSDASNANAKRRVEVDPSASGFAKMVARFENDESQQISLLAMTVYAAILAFTVYTGDHPPMEELFIILRKGMKLAFLAMAVHIIFHYVDVHKRWGLLHTSESSAHFKFTLKTWWIVLAWSIGGDFSFRLLGIIHANPAEGDLINWSLPPSYKVLRSTGPVQDFLWAVVFFYVIDLGRYWLHRIGHYSFFYKTFPFSHHHHHNQMYMSPLVTFISPAVHLALYATYVPIVFMWSQGLENSVRMLHYWIVFANLTQHLGFDPMPWLTRINHKLCGLLPWVPLYHQYHHIPFVKSGNFGNTTVFWDYVFGTVIPESVYHLETGHMPDSVRHWVEHPRAEQIWEDLLKRKARLDLNEKWSDVFKFYITG